MAADHQRRRRRANFLTLSATLSNWAKNRMADRLPIDDDLIREEARKFASTLGSAECNTQVNDPVWLEKFKQKNHVPGARPKGEKITAESLDLKSGSQTPNGTSPTVGWDGMPVSHIKEEPQTKSPESVFSNTNPWGHTQTQSTASCFTETHFSTDFHSPNSPYFSPMSSCGPSPSMPAQKAPRLPTLAPAKLSRRQTVPMISSTNTSPTDSRGTPTLPSIIDPAHHSNHNINGNSNTTPNEMDTSPHWHRHKSRLPNHTPLNHHPHEPSPPPPPPPQQQHHQRGSRRRHPLTLLHGPAFLRQQHLPHHPRQRQRQRHDRLAAFPSRSPRRAGDIAEVHRMPTQRSCGSARLSGHGEVDAAFEAGAAGTAAASGAEPAPAPAAVVTGGHVSDSAADGGTSGWDVADGEEEEEE